VVTMTCRLICFPRIFAHLGGLQRQLAGGHEKKCLDLGPVDVNLLQGWDDECRCLASTVLCTCKTSRLSEGDRDSLFLDWRRPLEAGSKIPMRSSRLRNMSSNSRLWLLLHLLSVGECLLGAGVGRISRRNHCLLTVWQKKFIFFGKG